MRNRIFHSPEVSPYKIFTTKEKTAIGDLETVCDGKFYVRTCLGYNTQLLNLGGAVNVFCRCSEHLKPVDLIKEIILDVSGPHPIR